MSRPKNARELMPKVSAWLDDLRGAFGADWIDAQIKAATTEGRPTFYASENGRRVGVPIPPAGSRELSAAEIVIHRPPKEEAHGRR